MIQHDCTHCPTHCLTRTEALRPLIGKPAGTRIRVVGANYHYRDEIYLAEAYTGGPMLAIQRGLKQVMSANGDRIVNQALVGIDLVKAELYEPEMGLCRECKGEFELELHKDFEGIPEWLPEAHYSTTSNHDGVGGCVGMYQNADPLPPKDPHHLNGRRYTHLVVILREGAPEVTMFTNLSDAVLAAERATERGSSTFLTSILKATVV